MNNCSSISWQELHYDNMMMMMVRAQLKKNTIYRTRGEYLNHYPTDVVPSLWNKTSPRLAAACDKVYHLLAHDRWFSPGTPTFSTTKTGRHDIAEYCWKWR